ncbi:MAG: squalene/phytoene synthase family protein [Elusimicrobiales bacterium]|nr:squalene/phytoene synthase family protein [Elusimicrobiales bacterium]HOL62285.1 squalene/phytoene synthase family protein [Elusimicrobiales bacterium]HPO95698.1 squalene/phytoene synthase family protein [Elusimicrobiales bacterium]
MKKYGISKESKRLLKHTSRTLYLSFSILPGYVKYMLAFGYLAARAMDSVIDSKDIKADLKLKFLDIVNLIGKEEFEAEFLKIKSGLTGGVFGWEKELLEKFSDIVLEFWKNADDCDRRNFKFLLKGLSKGMRMDVNAFSNENGMGSFSSFKELIRYANLIGGVPSIFWYRVYLKYDPEIFKNNVVKSAYRIGTALQLTNILKDMHCDLKNNRSYVPKEFLVKAGLDEKDLKDPKNVEKIKPFINSIILTCVDYFDESELFIDSIKSSEFSLKLALIWPIYWAMDSLYLVSVKNPLKNRIKISRVKIYKTLIKSPLLLSSIAFHQGYRFRRETLILSLNNK